MMTTEPHSDDPQTSNEKVYKLRKRNFQRNFTANIAILGYILILLQYIKYGTSAWILIIRASFQSLLSSPFPNDNYLLRIANRTNSNSNSNSNTSSDSTPDLGSLPGAFVSAADINNNGNSETAATVTEILQKTEIITVKKKIRKLLFHGALTLNLIYLIWDILHPVHFIDKLNGQNLNQKNLTNTPSPFLNDNGILGGERRGGLFLQFIGEALPQSDYWGNVGIVGYDFIILIFQYTLFVLTCINFGELGYKEPLDKRMHTSDGYDGQVFIGQIDYNSAVKDVIETDRQATSLV